MGNGPSVSPTAPRRWGLLGARALLVPDIPGCQAEGWVPNVPVCPVQLMPCLPPKGVLMCGRAVDFLVDGTMGNAALK